MKHVGDVRPLKQDDLLAKKTAGEVMDRPILILEYNPANPDILSILKQEWPTLEASPKLSRLFPNTPMLAHKRSPNLRDLLVRSATDYPPSPPSQSMVKFDPNGKVCRRIKKCDLCPNKAMQGHVKSHFTKETYRTTKKVTCETRNVIYCLECKQCGKQYIGETKRSFRIRVNEHLGDIRNYRNYKPVARHFNSKNHNINCVKSYILESISRDPELDSTTEVRRK